MSDKQSELPELDMSAVLEIHPQPDATPTPQPAQVAKPDLEPDAALNTDELTDLDLGALDDIFDDVNPPKTEESNEGSDVDFNDLAPAMDNNATVLDLDSLSLSEAGEPTALNIDTPQPETAAETISIADEPAAPLAEPDFAEENAGEFDTRSLRDEESESEATTIDFPQTPADAPKLPAMDFSHLDINTGEIESPFANNAPPDTDAPIIPLGGDEPPGVSALMPEDMPDTSEALKDLLAKQSQSEEQDGAPAQPNIEQAKAAFLAAIDGEAFKSEELPPANILLMCMIRVMANTMGNREDFIDALDSLMTKNLK